MNSKKEMDERVDRLVGWYGDGADGSSPTAEQWRHVLERPGGTPVTFINYFKMRKSARYPAGSEDSGTGKQAFDRYAAVSVPTVEKVGGKFLLLAPFEATFIGEAEDWDLIAIGSYPNSAAVLALYEDPGYRAVFFHRTAGCQRQKVYVCTA